MNLSEIKNNFNNGLEAIGLRSPAALESKSYTGKLWSNYTNLVLKAEPTRFKAVNVMARVITAAAVAFPIIATIATFVADTVIFAKNGLVSLKNKIFKKEEVTKFEKIANFVKEHKSGFITYIVSSFIIISAISAHEEEVVEAVFDAYDKTLEKVSNARSYIFNKMSPSEKELSFLENIMAKPFKAFPGF